jgi:hypothetical protein
MNIGGQGDPREWDQMDFRRFWKPLKPEPPSHRSGGMMRDWSFQTMLPALSRDGFEFLTPERHDAVCPGDFFQWTGET